MDIERAARFHALLDRLLELEPADRADLLVAECASDPGLRRELERALDAEARDLDAFFELPDLGAAANAAPVEVPSSPPPSGASLRLDVPRPSFHQSSTSTTRPSTSLLTTSLVARLRAAGGLPIFLALLVLAPILVVAAGVATARMLSAPDPHLSFGSWTGRLLFVDTEAWPGLESGDVLVELEGVAVEGDPSRIRKLFLGFEPGAVDAKVRRGEEVLEVRGRVSPFSVVERIVAWSRTAIGLSLLVIGLGAFALRPAYPASRLFLALCATLATYLLVYLALFRHPPVALLLEKLSLYLTVGCAMHLYACYPRPLVAPRWRLVFYAPFVVAVLAGAGYRSEDPQAAFLMVQLAPLFATLTAVPSLIFAVLQLGAARRSGDIIALARGRASLVALVSLGISVLLDLLPLFHSTLAWMFNSSLVVVFVGVLAFSIVRHNALDIDRFTAALVGYGGTTLVLAALFAALVVGVPVLLGLGGGVESPVLAAGLAGFCFLIFQPLHRRLRKRIDRLFLRQEREEGTEVRLLHRLASTVRVKELPEALREALETLEVLGAERLELWARTPQGTSFTRIAERGDAAPELEPGLEEVGLEGPLGGALQAGSGGGIEGLVDCAFVVPAQDQLWQLGLAMAAPIASDDRLEGFVAAGRKRNGTPFTERDRLFLEAVATQLAIAMDRNWQRAQRVGGYVLRRRLGTGGMAEVHLAEKLGPGGFGRRVAMKRILPHLAHERDAIAMFLDEARIAARLHHPNIVQVYDIEEHEGTYYLSMELLDGPSLKSWIDAARESPELLPLEAALAVAEALLEALGHVHRRADEKGRGLRLVHRDVKPANVLTSHEGDLKLGDFGIARAELRLYQTSPGMSRGTPPYMAPEVLHGDPATPRSDLFAAGSVIFEAVTLQMAFKKGPLESQRPPLPERLGELIPRLETFFDRALAMEPEGRYEDARAMLAALLEAAAPTRPATRREVASRLGEIRAL